MNQEAAEYKTATTTNSVLKEEIASEEVEEEKDGERILRAAALFNMPAACNVEISFMCFGRGVPESKAR